MSNNITIDKLREAKDILDKAEMPDHDSSFFLHGCKEDFFKVSRFNDRQIMDHLKKSKIKNRLRTKRIT